MSIVEKETTPQIKLKRIYDKPSKSDGNRVLVDRLWLRGISKEKAVLSEWAKEIAPTGQLRNWFDHDPDLWEAFNNKYKIELNKNDSFNDFVERLSTKMRITLVYSTTYDQLTHAIILKKLLEGIYVK